MKLQNIQALRGIAVLFVVFFHIHIVEKKYSTFNTILPEIFRVGGLGVDIFFIISGFIMVTVTRGKFQNLREAFRFLGNRLTRIYPLYWVYTILALIVFLIQPTWVNNVEGNNVNIFESFLLIPSDRRLLVQVGWTLIYEIYFYLVYFLIFLMLPEKFLLWALVAWGVLVTAINLLLPLDMPLFNLIFNSLTLEFLVGCIAAIYYYEREKFRLKPKVLVIMAVVSLLLAFVGDYYYQVLTGTVITLGWSRVILYGLPALVFTYCLITAEQSGVILGSALSRVGDASYSIYLSHLFTVNVVGRLWARISVEHWIDNLIFILLTLFAVLIVGFLSYELIEKRVIGFSRRIINL